MKAVSIHVARGLLATLLMLVAGTGGCPMAPNPDGDGNLDTSDNGTFKSATQVSLGNDDAIEFTGSISTPDDVDLFNLGTIERGDGVVIDVQTTSGDLDPVAALFDSREYIHGFNDDRDSGDLNPRMDFVVRGPQGTYFLGIAAFPGSATTGEYRVTVEVSRGAGVPALDPQIAFLNWAGGSNIVIPNVGVFDLEPFDATDVGPYPGQTEAMKDRVQQVVADRFDGFALVLRNSDDDVRPTVPHSTVHFGGRSRVAFAISEQIDLWNVDRSDDSIIFTESFPQSFVFTPTFGQMATALGNTVAHEIGHLLGLVHTRECSSLMDTTCGNDSLLIDQAFKLAPLDDSVFPAGFQDALELIEWTLGFAAI